MKEIKRISGIFAPVVTPFKEDLTPDKDRFARHCRWIASQNVGLAIFGTNSEANSLSTKEKLALIDHLVADGVPPSSLLPGTGTCSITDSIELTRHALSHGCAGVLMLPPFYYKNVSDEGIYDFYARVIDQIGDPNLRLLLYHIPQLSQIPLTPEVIHKLVSSYPKVVAGIKDSSGDWDNTALLISGGWEDFSVFAGSELFLLQTMRAGGAGCISATANVNPAAIYQLFADWQAQDADRRQAALNNVRLGFQEFPMIPALKAAIALQLNDPTWSIVRPPLRSLDRMENSKLRNKLEALNVRINDIADV